ncbi:hypothetical protein LTR56_017712 [Elasticomyces elasticus]|nr:hypothetical protein LTR56_017712 [Elasticomyces elasticus]KAK3637752.1 hypothetical protein LTR22_018153 [Elasticomyces elasticus]KAK4915350.1 hypothetical protein LTR49_016481 [Elasticomyces elasticus]KAK5752284.1 hypothetical protein LTS12_017678 [Elasticomyces elasticus]
MSGREYHFRFLDLPPELRVRIYECYFEPNPDTPEEVDLFHLQEYAPNVAVLRTSKLLCHESYPIGKKALAEFFTFRNFAVDLERNFTPSRMLSPVFQAAAKALPSFPIPALRLRFDGLLGYNNYSWCVSVSTRPDNKDTHVVFSVQRDDQPFGVAQDLILLQ